MTLRATRESRRTSRQWRNAVCLGIVLTSVSPGFFSPFEMVNGAKKIVSQIESMSDRDACSKGSSKPAFDANAPGEENSMVKTADDPNVQKPNVDVAALHEAACDAPEYVMKIVEGSELSPAFEMELQRILEEMHADIKSYVHFVHLDIYKTQLFDKTIQKELEEAWAHHRGVVFTVQNGSQNQYLRLDYGPTCLSFNLTSAFPTIKKSYNWSTAHQFQSTEIPSRLGNPKRLAEVLKAWKDKTYNLFVWNCHNFTRVIWLYFFPYSTGWVPDLNEVLEYVHNRTACSNKETRAKLDAAISEIKELRLRHQWTDVDLNALN